MDVRVVCLFVCACDCLFACFVVVVCWWYNGCGCCLFLLFVNMSCFFIVVCWWLWFVVVCGMLLFVVGCCVVFVCWRALSCVCC